MKTYTVTIEVDTDRFRKFTRDNTSSIESLICAEIDWTENGGMTCKDIEEAKE